MSDLWEVSEGVQESLHADSTLLVCVVMLTHQSGLGLKC